MSPLVIQAIISSAKIHAGQLVELSKIIQIEELKQKCALEFPQIDIEDDVQEISQEKLKNASRFIAPSGHYLGDKAYTKFKERVAHLPAALPHHMREARMRTI